MAHKKAGGSSRNGRDTAGRRLGVKKFGGEEVRAGNIIIRQRGTKWHPGSGVGIGVDYALYVLSVTLANLKAGRTLSQAYYGALLFTGKVVVLTGVTLGIAVATWAFSPIKFQGDMGILLAFMFVWNMLGALVLIPALSYVLLPTSRVRRGRAWNR